MDKVNNKNTAKKSKEKIVNIYAQPQPEFASTVIASSAGLKKIVNAINKAIEEGKSNCMLYTSDKKPFELLLIRNDESLNTKFWQTLQLPYTEYELEEKSTFRYGPTEYYDSDIRSSVDLEKEITWEQHKYRVNNKDIR